MDMMVDTRWRNEAWGVIYFKNHGEKVDNPTSGYKGARRRSRVVRYRNWKGSEGRFTMEKGTC